MPGATIEYDVKPGEDPTRFIYEIRFPAGTEFRFIKPEGGEHGFGPFEVMEERDDRILLVHESGEPVNFEYELDIPQTISR